MVTKTIFKRTSQLLEDLDLKINEVNTDGNDLIKTSEKALLIIDESIRKLKLLVSNHHFDHIAEEVLFFKKLKPQFISKFIYYSAVLDIESHKPAAGNKTLKKYYEAEQEKLKNFCSLLHQN